MLINPNLSSPSSTDQSTSDWIQPRIKIRKPSNSKHKLQVKNLSERTLYSASPNKRSIRVTVVFWALSKLRSLWINRSQFNLNLRKVHLEDQNQAPQKPRTAVQALVLELSICKLPRNRALVLNNQVYWSLQLKTGHLPLRKIQLKAFYKGHKTVTKRSRVTRCRRDHLRHWKIKLLS